MKIYHFGCANHDLGHFLHRPDGQSQIGHELTEFVYSNPWGHNIDGGLCPAGPEVEGRALLWHKGGWTAIAFWDRSVDHRGKSNSAFIAEGTHDFDTMLAFAKAHFPSIFKRFSFEVTLYSPPYEGKAKATT